MNASPVTTSRSLKGIWDGMPEIPRTLWVIIDGIVATYNDVAYAKSCGRTGHHYKDGLAFKFEDERFETKLIGIEWNPTFPAVLGFQQPDRTGGQIASILIGLAAAELRDFARDKDIPIDGIVATYNDVADHVPLGHQHPIARHQLQRLDEGQVM